MKKYLQLIRIKHYLKNILILFPLFFSGNLLNKALLIKTIYGFISFCLICSVVYVINDIKDKEKDKLHKEKKKRPIASGKVSIKEAYITIFILLILSIIFFMLANIETKISMYLITYLIINIFYSFGLKNVPLVDISILVSGFLIRVLYGGAIINIEISNWLYLTVISMAFYLVIGKRRNEVINYKKNTRKVLQYYSKDFLDKNLYMCLSLAIIFYSLWTMDYQTGNTMLIWTVPIVILICMKYSMNIESGGDGDPTEILYSDKVLLSLIIVYATFIISCIYLV